VTAFSILQVRLLVKKGVLIQVGFWWKNTPQGRGGVQKSSRPADTRNKVGSWSHAKFLGSPTSENVGEFTSKILLAESFKNGESCERREWFQRLFSQTKREGGGSKKN